MEEGQLKKIIIWYMNNICIKGLWFCKQRATTDFCILGQYLLRRQVDMIYERPSC